MGYKIQQRIETLARNAVGLAEAPTPSFDLSGISFSQWDFSPANGWGGGAWIAEAHIDTSNWREAYSVFLGRLSTIAPRLSLVCQCYVEFMSQSFLIVKDGECVGYFYDTFSRLPVGLTFLEDQHQALGELTQGTDIPEHFYHYWNDMVNVTGYTAKLLCAFSALETFKSPNGKKDWEKIQSILGDELYEAVYNQKFGLRHRLAHGEYFLAPDDKRNFIEEIHRKVIEFFNAEVFSKPLLNAKIVNPQRNPAGNRSVGRYFINTADPSAHPLELKRVMADFAASRNHRPTNYEYVFNETLLASY